MIAPMRVVVKNFSTSWDRRHLYILLFLLRILINMHFGVPSFFIIIVLLCLSSWLGFNFLIDILIA